MKSSNTVDHSETIFTKPNAGNAIEVVRRSENTLEYSFNYKDSVDDEVKAIIRQNAEEISISMENRSNEVPEFGVSILKTVNDTTDRLLRIQSDIELGEADNIVDSLLREVEGYGKSHEVEQPADDTVEDFFSKFTKKLMAFFKFKKAGIKEMDEDANKIYRKMERLEEEIIKTEGALSGNVERGEEIREEMILASDQIPVILASLEIILEHTQERGRKLIEELEKAEKSGNENAVLVLKEKIGRNQSSQALIKKTWASWRQKLFLFRADISSTANVINASSSLRDTYKRIREHAIPAVKTRIASWQQAEKARQAAEISLSVSKGINDLIVAASEGSADAVTKSIEADGHIIIDDNSIKAIVGSLAKQFDAVANSRKDFDQKMLTQIKLIEDSGRIIAEKKEAATEAVVNAAISGAKSAGLLGDNKHANNTKRIEALTTEDNTNVVDAFERITS